MRSSPEWYESTAQRPPGCRAAMPASMAGASTSSSAFTAMRIAWNVRLAGWPPVRRAGAGMASRTISASSVGGGHRAGGDDRLGDAAGEALVAEGAEEPGQLLLVGVVHDVGRGADLALVHAHVERARRAGS